MRLITERDKIKEAITNFREAWGDGSYPADKRGIAIGAELGELDSDNVAVEKVNELIGNESWTRLKCNECGGNSKAVIELGDEPDYESSTALVCFDCIRRAADMTHNSGVKRVAEGNPLERLVIRLRWEIETSKKALAVVVYLLSVLGAVSIFIWRFPCL